MKPVISYIGGHCGSTRCHVVSTPLTFCGSSLRRQTDQPDDCPSHSALLWFTNNTELSSRCSRSVLLPSLPVLPASHILKWTCRRVRCHQPISHPLVDQGGVGGYSTQQHGEASVQHVTYAAQQRGGGSKFGKTTCGSKSL